MIVRHHDPEPAQGLGGNRDTELRDVAFEKRSNEIVTPGLARGVVGGEERAGEPSPGPKAILVLRARFTKVEPSKVDETDATRERLRHALDELRRCGAEQEEASGVVWTIHEDAD